jgi:(p)ppGpp synthase/HD superfamily hydrolase
LLNLSIQYFSADYILRRGMNDLELLEKAIEIAVTAHRGQKDRHGAPYILHPLRVMARVDTVPEKIVAILHDVVEDTNWTFESLRQEGFPEKLLAALRCVTKQQDEAYEAFVERSASDPIARRVKLADLEDNMDVRRLPELKEAELKRLAKYRAAWERLRKETAG